MPHKILFICTHNRCRSIIAEAVTRHLSHGRVIAASAGSSPAGEVHPLSLTYLTERGIPINNLRSQSWDEFQHFKPSLIVTLCDQASAETCPAWFGEGISLHWGLKDPSSSATGDGRQAFFLVIKQIEQLIGALLKEDIESIDQAEFANLFTRATEMVDQ